MQLWQEATITSLRKRWWYLPVSVLATILLGTVEHRFYETMNGLIDKYFIPSLRSPLLMLGGGLWKSVWVGFGIALVVLLVLVIHAYFVSGRTAQQHPEIILSTEWPSAWPPGANHPPMRFVQPLNQPYERPFVVSNESDITAYNVKIRDIEGNGMRAQYEPIDFVRRGEDKPATPRVQGEGNPMRARSLVSLFPEDVLLNPPRGPREIMTTAKTVITDYRDSRGRGWETEQEMTFDIWFQTATFRLVYCGPKRQ
jgi:hypothetical protein